MSSFRIEKVSGSEKTLYEEAQALFEKPVWYRLDSTAAQVPLLG
jgi:hypothetical protein